jgi:hypothetical protein
MSLIKELNDEIKKRGFISVSDFNKLVDSLGYKRSNAERRVRKSDSPMIEPVKNKRLAPLVAYYCRSI